VSYEQLSELANVVEHIKIHELIRKRKGKNTGKRIGLDTLLKDEGENLEVYRAAFERILKERGK
jgi:hypothetical protein